MTDNDVRALAEEFWEVQLRASPTLATFVGDHRYDDRIEDLSAEYEAQLRDHWASLNSRVQGLDTDSLARPDRVTAALLLAATRDGIDACDLRLVELQSDQMNGVHTELLQTVPVLNAPEPDHAYRLLERFRQVPTLLEQAMKRFTLGLEAGRTPARICIERSLNTLDGYLATPLEQDVFVGLSGPSNWDGETAWREELAEAARDVIRPAFAHYRETMAAQLAPNARPDEQPGLCWLPDGKEIYHSLIRQHTTLTLDPEEIHSIGMTEVLDRLPHEYAEVGGRLFGITDVDEIFNRLRTDPNLRYDTAAEIMDDARAGLEAARGAMGAWFGTLPQAECLIAEVPEFLAPDSPAAYYFPPAGDGSRPGTYFVNTFQPGEKNRYEARSVAYHEAIPGHHLQISIANELTDVPQFQRFSLSNTAYVEGWGLYAERLAEDMGLYTTDLDRIGMLAADSWRACRLVVDTGMHALGWTRQEAIDFMARYTPVSLDEVTVEIDRYIGMPGQALAYKLGQREILRLRAHATEVLGEAFDIKGFHDTVLASGAVTLPILADLVEGWITAQR